MISVSNHKTATSHGAANVSVSLDQLKRLKILMSMSKSVFGSKTRWAFPTHPGSTRSTSWLNRALQRVWRMAGCEEKYGRYSLTRNRKSLTSLMRRKDPSLADDVASQLCHRRSTADAYYNLEDRVSKSATTVNRMRRYLATPSAAPRTDSATENVPAEKDAVTETPEIESKFAFLLVDLFNVQSSYVICFFPRLKFAYVYTVSSFQKNGDTRRRSGL